MSRSEIISSHPIGGRLEEYHELYNICQYQNGIDPLLQREADVSTKNKLLDFLMAVQALPACRILSSSRGSGTLFGDISRISSTIDSGQAQIDRLLPLLKAVRDKEPDEIIWDKVYEAVTESTPAPLPLCSLQQTPLTRNTGSVVNSSELRTDMDTVLREELDMYVDIPKFYDTFFGDILELQTTQAVFESCKEGEEPLFREGTGWTGWPEGAKEAPVLAWLSGTIDKMIQFFEEHAPGETTRRRPLAQPHKPLKGSTAKRTLDIGFMDGTKPCEDGKYAWSQILVPGELKNDPDYETRSRQDIGRYAREVLVAQDSRLFVPGFTLCGSLMRLWQFNRLGGIASEQFNIHEEGLRFVSAMLGYLLMSKEQLGFDPTIVTNADGARYIKIERDGREERLVIDEVVRRAECVSGRATTCWRTHRDGDESRATLVVKDSWQYPERNEEGELLHEATEKEVVNVARYYHHETIPVQGRGDICEGVIRGLDITAASNYKQAGSRPPLSRSGSRKGKSSRAASRKRSSTCVEPSLPPSKRQQSQPPSTLNRIHRRVVVRDYGQPIYKASSRVALLAALEGCIEGYESLYRQAGILQRDISPNNLMINEDKKSASWKAFIIDLDLAIKEDRVDTSGARGKTGTLAFIAIGVLLDEQHSFMHDLESFFWVLFWICIHYDGPGKGRVVKEYNDWNYMSTEKLAELKKGKVGDERDFLKSTAAQFTDYYQPFVPWVNRLRRVVFPNGGRWKTPDKSLYSAMREILRNAQEDPDIIGLN
ncbi:FunK1 protein kinase [Trichophyton equinum CBS 127.97]|uniref:FunK1 protein kinase n=1 Tax=Trichophyton equinum (strain ATCC MYA-4606 / CBS 127.97) TaxID=559882 RepID=F2Q4D0_TRIEC|nr:FunK1 protein kinase [Trichophyton equinum CBS 127.97]